MVWFALRARGWWVHHASVPAFIRWRARLPLRLRQQLAILRGAALSSRPPPGFARLERLAAAAGMSAGIIRLPSDNQGVQVFDPTAGLVLHVKKSRDADLAHELENRDRAGPDVSPAIRWRSLDEGAFAEALLTTVRQPTVEDVMQILETLKARLYATRTASLDQWLETLTAQGRLDDAGEGLAAALRAHVNPATLLVCTVHGDLNPGNVYPIVKGELRLGDWEYTREALLSYDAWLASRYWPSLDFDAVAESLWAPFQRPRGLWLHGAHLLEWYSYLSARPPNQARALRARLRTESLQLTKSIMHKGRGHHGVTIG